MRIFSYLLALIIILIGLSFAGLNAQLVNFNYYIGTYTLPLSLLLVFTLGIGCLLGLVVSIGLVFKLKRETRRLRKQVGLIEKEVSNLRAIPLKNEH